VHRGAGATPGSGRGSSFIERDAGADPGAAEALAATSTFATPLFVIENK
jgi:hypothetical protein